MPEAYAGITDKASKQIHPTTISQLGIHTNTISQGDVEQIVSMQTAKGFEHQNQKEASNYSQPGQVMGIIDETRQVIQTVDNSG